MNGDKPIKWFKHDSDGFTSEGGEALIAKLGFAGYGRWNRVLEIVAFKMDHTTRCHAEYPITKWCSLLGLKQKKLILFLQLTEKELKTKVVYSENKIRIEIPNLLKKRDNYTKDLEVKSAKLPSKEVDVEVDKEETKKGAGKRKVKPRKDPDLVTNVVEYLNEVLGTNYKATTRKTRDLVSARAGEGHTLSDFKIVIDKKAAEWKDDPDNAKYLRPETLFGTKFEGYLNQLGGKKGAKDKEREGREHTARLKKAIATGKDITGRRLPDYEIQKHKDELKRIGKAEAEDGRN